MSTYKIEYNIRGWLKYNPDFHAKQFEPWTPEDDDYLMKFYKYEFYTLKSRGFKVSE